MIGLTRTHHRITPDAARVVARPFLPGGLNFGGDSSRIDLIVDRALDLTTNEQKDLLEAARKRSSGSLSDIESTWLENLELGLARMARPRVVTDPEIRLLLGACLTQAYAYEGAALTNPSLVGLDEDEAGNLRVVMSARAIGEGHISSIAFLTGSVGPSGELTFDSRHPTVSNGERRAPVYKRSAFLQKLTELSLANDVSEHVLSMVSDEFTSQQLDMALSKVVNTDLDSVLLSDTVKLIHWLAASNYEVHFDEERPISEHLISPAAPAESHGMEDARFVRFVDDDGNVTYYATYTAFDGTRILPQLIETKTFHSFRMATMSGPTAYHKGMALFPRMIDGEYVALTRHDHETTFIMRSDDLRHWTNAEAVLVPDQGWELIQTGNCGSPIETDDGWLTITHGVGPMRRYVLGAVLLDLDEPTKVIGRLRSPLLEPEGEETVGYVPDVVYSCGSLIHQGSLIIPYGCADRWIAVATVPVDQVLAEMS
jgi:predicted GH43/DUF377 family glycosyl hydrolase